MKLCIPSLGKNGLSEKIGEHFGRVPFYTFYDTRSKELEIMANSSNHMGGTKYPAEIIADAGANVMLCGGVGRRAIQMFQERGIMVYVGASGSVGNAIQLWESGALEAATDETACRQHAFRGEGHGDGDHQH